MSKNRNNINYLEGLLNNDKKIIEKIYDDFLFRIEALIKKNGGSKEDAWEIFQEGLMVILKKARRKDFSLYSAFYTLLYAICRNLWLNEMQKKYRSEVTIQDDHKYISDTNLEKTYSEFEQIALYKQKFSLLSDKCKRLLTLFFNGNSFKIIAKEVGYLNDLVAKKEKYKCQKHLIKTIQEDPVYTELSHKKKIK